VASLSGLFVQQKSSALKLVYSLFGILLATGFGHSMLAGQLPAVAVGFILGWGDPQRSCPCSYGANETFLQHQKPAV